MAMFTRRTLQHAIDSSLPYASQQQRWDWVSTLNSPKSPKYISTEWELMVLQALSGLGVLRHEAELGGLTKPDIHLQSSSLVFVADITTISDRGRHEQNPIRLFEEELRTRWLRSGIVEGGFAFYASTHLQVGKGSTSPTVVPPATEFGVLIFNKAFEDFVQAVKAEPAVKKQLDVWWNRNSVVQIIYVPGRTNVWCNGHTSYTVPMQKERNPLFVALKDKADQLKRCGFEGLKGVVVCDGGAHVLRENIGNHSFSTRDVVFHALNRHTSIDFVLVISLRGETSMSIRQRLEPKLYVRDVRAWAKDLDAIFSAAVSRMPQVMQTPDNARSELAYWQGREKQQAHVRGLTYSSGRNGLGKIRMSTQTLLEVLGGRLSVKRLNEAYSLNKREGLFEHQLRMGCTIESAIVEKNPENDSDDIVFTFGLPDSSVSRFVLPPNEQLETEGF